MARSGPPSSVANPSDQGIAHGHAPTLEVVPGSQAPEDAGIPEGLPAIPMEQFAAHFPDDLPDDADAELPDIFGA